MRALAVFVSILVASSCLMACGGSDATDNSTTASPTTTATATAAAATTTAPAGPPEPVNVETAGATKVGDLGAPDWLVVAGGSAWAAGVGDGVGQLDGATGKLLGSVAVPGSVCLAMDVGFDSVWVGSCAADPAIVRIDPATAKVAATIPLDIEDLAEESSLAAGEGAVWAVTSDSKLVKIDPDKNAVAATYPLPAGAAAVRADFGALWVTNPDAGTLARLNPADASVEAEIPVGSGPRFLAVGEGGVWVLNQGDGTVTHVDPATNKVVATIVVDSQPIGGGDIAAGGGAVWARVSGALLVKIDPATDTAVAAYGPRVGSGSVAADDDAMWVSAHDVNSVWRLPLS
jgi:YVTN family beta-propeller protein